MTAKSVREQAIEAAALAIFDEEGPECIDDDGADALAQVALAAAVPVLLNDLADSIEALDWTWHFRGPGDGGGRIVARHAVLSIVRSAAEGWGQ